MPTEGVGSEIVPDNKEMVLKYSTTTKKKNGFSIQNWNRSNQILALCVYYIMCAATKQLKLRSTSYKLQVSEWTTLIIALEIS